MKMKKNVIEMQNSADNIGLAIWVQDSKKVHGRFKKT